VAGPRRIITHRRAHGAGARLGAGLFRQKSGDIGKRHKAKDGGKMWKEGSRFRIKLENANTSPCLATRGCNPQFFAIAKAIWISRRGDGTGLGRQKNSVSTQGKRSFEKGRLPAAIGAAKPEDQ
jgi:hypothetical protein